MTPCSPKRSPDKVLDSPVSDSESTAPDVSKVEYPSNAAERHVLALETAQSSATSELNELKKILTYAPPENAGELHVKAPITSTTPEPIDLEAMGKPSLDISKASNATEHVVYTQNEVTDESCNIARDPPLATSGMTDEKIVLNTRAGSAQGRFN